jgi:hypothetical protein
MKVIVALFGIVIRNLVHLSPTKLTNIPPFTSGKKSDDIMDYLKVIKNAPPYIRQQLWPLIFATFNILRVTHFDAGNDFIEFQEKLNKFWGVV